jgi:hypothetical protein
LGPFFFLFLLLSTSLVTVAQEKDAHYLTPRIAPTARRSTFIHGYLHGYEEGFHNADFDLHMGRVARGDYAPEAKPGGYRKQFGPKRMFESGFREGFRVGYADAAAGRSFRAIQNVEAASESDTATDVREMLSFDEGIRQGYIAGQHQGLSDARGQHESKPSPMCPVKSDATKQEFCVAYASGYGMGYSDGYVNQAKTVVAEAK